MRTFFFFFFFFQAEDGIRDTSVTGVQTCALRSLPSSGWRIVLRLRDTGPSARRSERRLSEPDLVRRGVREPPDEGDPVRIFDRSEERRVGKECRCGGWGDR